MDSNVDYKASASCSGEHREQQADPEYKLRYWFALKPNFLVEKLELSFYRNMYSCGVSKSHVWWNESARHSNMQKKNENGK